MSKCKGCGVVLQDVDKTELGYVTNINNEYCERCFRINNYGEYKIVTKSNDEFINILKSINLTNDLVVLVVDIFNLSDELGVIRKYLSNDLLLVLTKRDLLPKSFSDEKLVNYLSKYNLNTVQNIVISSSKNYNFDFLYEQINKYKKSKKVYVVGFTNAGKSTMINKLIYNYGSDNSMITTSILPSTTLDQIEVKITDNLTIIDTPGILSNGSIYDFLSGKELKKVLPKKEIKPISYQIKGRQYLSVEKYLKIDVENVNIVMFMSNSLDIKRYYKDFETSLVKHHFNVCNCDIVVNGLGFIKVVGSGSVNVYALEGVRVYIRKSLI